jgi:uncharacterized protein (PEP-CTERM system associated)
MRQYCSPVQDIAWNLLLIGSFAAAGAAHADTFQFSPSITLQEVYTSDSGGGQGSNDLVTVISPGFSLNETGPWSTVTLNYAPAYNHYDFHSAPDRLDQNLNGAATITPFEKELVIDLNVYASEAGATPNSNTLLNNLLVASNNRVLYYTGSFVPHFTHRFGDVATLDAFYRLTSSNVSDQSLHEAPGTSYSSDTLQQDAEIIIGSGNSFGRISAQLDFDHDVGTGSGQNTNSMNDKDFLALQYHLNSNYALTSSIGYQRLHYDGTSLSLPYTNEGMTWNVGVRATPNPDSLLALSYGLQEGIYVPTLQLSYSLGPRTRITASYLVQIQSQLGTTLQTLQFLSYDSLGNPIDSRTGLPFSLTNQIFGSQNVLFRDKPAQVAVVHQLERSAITLRLLYEQRSSVTGLPQRDRVSSVDLAYSRDLSPLTSGSIDFGYTTNVSSGLFSTGNTRTDLVNFTFSLTWNLGRDAFAYFNGTLYKPVLMTSQGAATIDQVTLGFRKAF